MRTFPLRALRRDSDRIPTGFRQRFPGRVDDETLHRPLRPARPDDPHQRQGRGPRRLFHRGPRARPPLDHRAAFRPPPEAQPDLRPAPRMGRGTGRYPLVVVRGILSHRRRPGGDHRPRPARSGPLLGPFPRPLDRRDPRPARAAGGGAQAHRPRRLGPARRARTLHLQQAAHRRLPHGREPEAHDPCPVPRHRHRGARSRPPADGRMASREHQLRRADPRPRPADGSSPSPTRSTWPTSSIAAPGSSTAPPPTGPPSASGTASAASSSSAAAPISSGRGARN